MMIGPMKKKVITASVVTAIILIVIFGVAAYFYISQNNKTISELKQKGEVVQRYVFTKDLAAGTVITEEDIKIVDVKGESAPSNSYEYSETMINGQKIVNDQKYDIVGRRLKVNVNNRMIVTESLFYEEDALPELDTRLQEFNMVTLPSDLNEGDYIDIRIRFATGEDYSVIVGKKIESFGASGSQNNTIFLRLNEEEIVRMSSAIIESYINDGVNLYANKYVDPSNQLNDYEYVNLIEKYEAVRYITEDSFEVVSGEVVTQATKTERSDAEIASLLGIGVNEVKDLKEAIKSEDKEKMESYQNKLVSTKKSIQATYPVKSEVAALIKDNPNILKDIKDKYNVEVLIAQRENLPSTEIEVVDPLTGEKTASEGVAKIKERLDKEIAAQRAERQEYLLKLLPNQRTSSTDETEE